MGGQKFTNSHSSCLSKISNIATVSNY